MRGMPADEAAMARTLPTTNTGSQGNDAITRKQAAPPAASRDAALAAGQPAAWTNVTTSGVINSPMLPPPATRALAVEPERNHFTAINSKNVVPAVSRI